MLVFSLNAFEYAVFNFNLNLAPGLHFQIIKDRKPNGPGKAVSWSCPWQVPSWKMPSLLLWVPGRQFSCTEKNCPAEGWMRKFCLGSGDSCLQKKPVCLMTSQRTAACQIFTVFQSRYNLPIRII